jgi:hypothetical protein
MDSSAARKALFLVALAWMFAATFQAATKLEFQQGQVLSITSGKGLDQNITHRWAVFAVQIGNVIYSGSGKRIRHPSDDYSEGLHDGEAVRAAVSGGELILVKPDGKELKTKIIKRELAE